MIMFGAPLFCEFLDSVAALRVNDRTPPAWLRETVLGRDKELCWHCGKDAARVVPLFSGLLGGVPVEHNLVAACEPCRLRFLDLDPVTFAWSSLEKPLSKKKATQRNGALVTADQHAVPATAQRSVAACKTWLEESRWLSPRVVVGVLCGDAETLFTHAQATPGQPWATFALAAKEAGARDVPGASGVLCIASTQWELLANVLIERGALLRRVHVNDAMGEWATRGVVMRKPGEPAPWDEVFQAVQGTARGSKHGR